MPDGPDDTGSRRRLSQSEADELVMASARAERSAQRDARVRDLELRLVEVIGIDGDGGEFAFVKRQQARHEERLEKMERQVADQALFQNSLKTSIRWTVALASLAATAIGALVLVLIEYVIKR